MTGNDSRSLRPFIVISLLLSLPPGILFLQHKLSIWSAPALLAVSLAGMASVVVMELRARKHIAGNASGVKHEELTATNVSSIAPWLKQNVRGHNEVIDALMAELQRNLRLSKSGRHLGAFLLVGPTGTGKTFLANLVGQALYPRSEPVVLRMNQYKHENDVFTLLGPPPGMPGYEVGGALTRPVMANPRRVVIFDELEKAHHDIHHCLYDILDAAVCREKSSGTLVDFSGCAFFATSNAGVEALRGLREQKVHPAEWLGRSRDALSEEGGFDKAFLARWGGIYLLDELPLVHVAEVACLQLAKYWREYGVEVAYTAPEIILETVMRNEQFKQYGVRQLGAFIQSTTGDAIALARSRGSRQVELRVESGKGLVVVERPAKAAK